MLATVWRRRREYSLAQVDVFSGRAFLWAEVVCLALRRLRKPYVLALHGGNLPAFARRWPGRVRRLLAGAVIVTSPSDYLRTELARFRVDIRAIPNGLALEAYPFRLRHHADARLVWLRAFHEIYDPAMAPRVAQALSARFPTVHLTMIGPDKGDGSLARARQAAATTAGTATIAFEGSIAKRDVPMWLGRGDIFLNTTTVDNLPTTVLEAMACGLCVVSTNVGGIPHMLTDGVNALLVSAGDYDGMTQAIARLLTDHDLAEQLSRRGRAVAERHDWAVVLPQWEDLLEEAASRARCT
jgi:glycosyltransferase involved in cell wall biosynthesis